MQKKIIKVEQKGMLPNSTFLEKLTTTMKFDGITELVLQDLYENINTLKQNECFPTILGDSTTEEMELQQQIQDMINKEELLDIHRGIHYITLAPNRVNEIFSSMEQEEKSNYFSLVSMYIEENMKKKQKQNKKS